MFIKQQVFVYFASIFITLAGQAMLNALATTAATNSANNRTILTKRPDTVRHTPVERGHTVHRPSTGIATLHIYTKVSDLKGDSLIRHLLRTAVGADSPDSNPDVNDKTAANLNLNINETLSASLIRQNKFDLDNLQDLDKDYVVLGNLTHDNIFHLTQGNALFVPKKDIVVLTDLGEIHVGADSIVAVLKPADGVVSIYDLEDKGGKSVSVKTGDDLLTLSPGKHLVLTKQANDFEKINPAHRIAYRKLEHSTLRSGIHSYSTEFSMSSAVLHIKALQNILLSNDKEDRKLANKVLKNFVILEDLFSTNEPYKMPDTMVAPVRISTNLN